MQIYNLGKYQLSTCDIGLKNIFKFLQLSRFNYDWEAKKNILTIIISDLSNMSKVKKTVPNVYTK